jgi:tetratricopeptide (TPR) repeat protein
MGDVRAEEAAELVIRAVTLHKQGDLAEAVKLYRRALRRTPERNNDFGLTRVVMALGHALTGLGRVDEAERAMRSALARDPNNVIAAANHAVLLRILGRLEEAEATARGALAIDPVYIPALHTLGSVLAQRRKFQEAEEIFLKVLERDPRHIQAMINLAAVRASCDRFDEAIVLFNRALNADPRSAEAHLNLGLALAEFGRPQQAIESLQRSIALDPNNVDAWYALSCAGDAVLEKQDAEHLVRLMEKGRLSDDQRVKLRFVLAGSAERLGNLMRAFADYRKANELRKEMLARAGHAYDPAAHAARIDHLITTTPKDVLAAPLAPARPGPVFVVGLPRSGTTLVERIIAAHPDAVGIGERDDIERLSVQLRAGGEPAALAETYLAETMELARGKRLVVDKTPTNFLHLGMIARLLPGARIIHIRRDLRDVGLSCFTQNFVQPHAWACDLDHIAHYASEYTRLMAHFRTELPPMMLEVDYERLVAEPEIESRIILEFLGLPWDPACLSFHASKGVVRSASKWQVRKPLYASSVGRWKAYQQFLGPLLAGLR